MKCVCPMGGDRTCPDDCPLAVWANLSPKDRKAQRKPIVERLYKQGFTMEQVGKQLGVTKKTISVDLKGVVTDGNNLASGPPKGKGTKGGRPKKPPATAAKHEKIVVLSTGGMAPREVAAEVGVGERMVHRVLEIEHTRRDAEAQIDPATLSLTAQQKLEAAVRQHRRQLDIQFEQRVRDEVVRRINDIVLPHWKQQIAQAQELYSKRRALMDKDTFNAIRRALHPDSRRSISDRVLTQAFNTFMTLEKYLLNERDSPTPFHDVPNNLAEWDAWRAQARAERKARRGMQTAPARR